LKIYLVPVGDFVNEFEYLLLCIQGVKKDNIIDYFQNNKVFGVLKPLLEQNGKKLLILKELGLKSVNFVGLELFFVFGELFLLVFLDFGLELSDQIVFTKIVSDFEVFLGVTLNQQVYKQLVKQYLEKWILFYVQ